MMSKPRVQTHTFPGFSMIGDRPSTWKPGNEAMVIAVAGTYGVKSIHWRLKLYDSTTFRPPLTIHLDLCIDNPACVTNIQIYKHVLQTYIHVYMLQYIPATLKMSFNFCQVTE